MSSRTLVMLMGLTVVLPSMFWMRTTAQPSSDSCTSTIISMSPCLNFVTGSSTSPSSQCCSQLSKVVQSSPRCLCMILDGGASSLGVTVNRTLALALPDACNVKTPPVSECNKGEVSHGPSSSPAGSPLPSENDTTGSAGSSNANGDVMMNKPLQLIVLFLVIITTSSSAAANWIPITI